MRWYSAKPQGLVVFFLHFTKCVLVFFSCVKRKVIKEFTVFPKNALLYPIVRLWWRKGNILVKALWTASLNKAIWLGLGELYHFSLYRNENSQTKKGKKLSRILSGNVVGSERGSWKFRRIEGAISVGSEVTRFLTSWFLLLLGLFRWCFGVVKRTPRCIAAILVDSSISAATK